LEKLGRTYLEILGRNRQDLEGLVKDLEKLGRTWKD
jgi:hypothetical protein